MDCCSAFCRLPQLQPPCDVPGFFCLLVPSSAEAELNLNRDVRLHHVCHCFPHNVADLVSLSEKIDTTSAAGKMIFRMLAVLAEFERDLISERTITALAHKRQLGKRTGTVPYGYDLHHDQESLVPNPDEQRIIDWMVELRSEGMSLRKIAARLTTKNIPTKSGNAEWTHTAVNRIVTRVAA